MSDTTYRPITKPSLRHGPFNWACWGGGAIVAIIVLLWSQEIIGLLPGMLIAAVGLPWKGSATIPRAIQKSLHSRAVARNDGGFMHRRAIISSQKQTLSPWDVSKIVEFTFVSNNEIRTLPVAWTADNNNVTVYFKLDGASIAWLDSDTGQKMNREVEFMNLMGRALSKGDTIGYVFGVTRTQRPADATEAFEALRLRGNDDILAAIDGPPSEVYDDVDKELGQNIMDGVDSVYNDNQAGDPYTFGYVIAPWPRQHGRRIKLTDTAAFQKSQLYRSIVGIATAFRQAGTSAELMDRHGVVQTLARNIAVRNLRYQQRWAQRDREWVQDGRVDDIDETPGANIEVWKPLSTRYDRDGFLEVDGTYLASGHVDSLTVESLDPGFMQQAFNFDQGSWWNFTLYCEIHSAKTERKKAKWKERGVHVLNSIDDSWSGHLSDPEGDARMAEVQDVRGRLATAGTRTAKWQLLFSVLTTRPDEVDLRWDDASDALAYIYELRRLWNVDELVDIAHAHVGVVSTK